MLFLATRAIGAIPFLRDLLPPVAINAFAALTWLGSVPVLVAVMTLAYWFGPRRRGAVGVGALLAAFAVTIGLKALFALPRPPTALHWIAASGFGFPSGHAIAATVGWGYLAMVNERWSTRHRIGLATLVIATVAVSRVAVGVHYAVDVVTGVAVGVAILAAVDRLERPERVFGLAAAAALFALAVTDLGDDSLLLFGGALAGAALWSQLAVPPEPWGREGLLPAVVGGAVVGVLVLVGYGGTVAPPLDLMVGVLAVSGVLGIPSLVGWVRKTG